MADTLIPIRDLPDLAYYGDPDTVLHGDGQWKKAANAIGAMVHHADDANHTRPDVDFPVMWVGSVEPLNALDGDIWLHE